MNHRLTTVALLGLALALALFHAPRPPGKWWALLSDPSFWGMGVQQPPSSEVSADEASPAEAASNANSTEAAQTPRADLAESPQSSVSPTFASHPSSAAAAEP